jgi:hypothetical protein
LSVSLKRSGTVLALVLAAGHADAAPKPEAWVSVDASGKLVYRTLPKGDRIVDFSYAGYMGGGVVLPKVPVVKALTPSGADDTAAIQRALDEVAALPLKEGLRGAVLLGPGTFVCSGPLNITASGVVLRGSGATPAGTALKQTGEPHIAIVVDGNEKATPVGAPAHIAEQYVPSGAQTIALDNASAFAVGDTIRITRSVTPEWVHFMGMDRMVRDGKPEVWVGNSIATERRVAARAGNVLTLDVPLTDSYDRAFLRPEGAEVVKLAVSGGIEQVGVESLRIVAPPRSVAFTDALFQTMALHGVRDAWVRNIESDDTTEGIEAGADSVRITAQDIAFHHTTTITSAAKPADFALRGSQFLVLRCSSTGNDEMYVITGPRNQGPNVVLESIFTGDGRIQPHQRWATGLLVDSTRVPSGGIDLMNRGQMGTGHGWTMGWGVVWNSSAGSFVIQNPPGAANWSIGNTGQEQTLPMKLIGVRGRDLGPPLPQGFVESPNHAVTPASLYRAQLAERLGPGALKALEP